MRPVLEYLRAGVADACRPIAFASSDTIYLGAWTGPSFSYTNPPDISDTVEKQAGYPLTAVHDWESWTTHHLAVIEWPLPFGGPAEQSQGILDPDLLIAVRDHRSVPLITWVPTYGRGQRPNNDAASQGPDSIPHILAGDLDSYIRQTASTCAAFGSEIIIRFCHEFNSSQPNDRNWSPGMTDWNGHLVTPDDYRSVWKYVHAIFQAEGASNVHWCWCPLDCKGERIPWTVGHGHWDPTEDTSDAGYSNVDSYPGDSYVDYLGCDAGYNRHVWAYFGTKFDTTYRRLTTPTPSWQAATAAKPVILAEHGCYPTDPSLTDCYTWKDPPPDTRASWFTRAYRHALTHPQLCAMVYFAHSCWMPNLDPDPRVRLSRPPGLRLTCSIRKSEAHVVYGQAGTSTAPWNETLSTRLVNYATPTGCRRRRTTQVKGCAAPPGVRCFSRAWVTSRKSPPKSDASCDGL